MLGRDADDLGPDLKRHAENDAVLRDEEEKARGAESFGILVCFHPYSPSHVKVELEEALTRPLA